jgi:hypothetical protein
MTSVKIAVGEKFRRSKIPSVKIAVGQNCYRSKLLSVKIAVGQNGRRSKLRWSKDLEPWPRSPGLGPKPGPFPKKIHFSEHNLSSCYQK